MRFFTTFLITGIITFSSHKLQAKTTLPNTISSPLPAFKDNTLAKMVDGDASTFFWSWRNPKKGETVTLDFPESLKGKNVTVRTGNEKGEDRIHNARIQFSKDGSLWRTLGFFKFGKAEGIIPTDAKYLRIEFYHDAWSWVQIRSFEVGNHALTRSTLISDVQVDGEKVPLKITIDREFVEDQKDAVDSLIDLYFKEWPTILKLIDAPLLSTPKHLFLSFDPTLKFPAYVSGTTMVISAQHMKSQKEDTYGLFSHELTHFVQNYEGGAPTWFTEGVAEHIRFKFHKEGVWAKNNIKYNTAKRPLGSYWNSMLFLHWLEKTYQKPIIQLVSRACSEKRYTHDIWEVITGESLEQLAEEYRKSS